MTTLRTDLGKGLLILLMKQRRDVPATPVLYNLAHFFCGNTPEGLDKLELFLLELDRLGLCITGKKDDGAHITQVNIIRGIRPD